MLFKFLTVIALVIGLISVLRPCLAVPPKLEEVELAGNKLAGTSTSGANPSLPPIIAEEVSPFESEQAEQSLAMLETGVDHGNAHESKEPAEIQAVESDSLEPIQDIVVPSAHGPVEGLDIHMAESFRRRTVMRIVVLSNTLLVLGGLSHRSFGFPESDRTISWALVIYLGLFTAWVAAFPDHFRD